MEREARNLLWFVGSFALVFALGCSFGCSAPRSNLAGDYSAARSPHVVLWTQSTPF